MPGDLIQTPQTRWIQGAYESVQVAQMRVLIVTNTAVAGNDRWSTMREQFTSAGYVVPAGKTLYLTRILKSTPAATTLFALLYGDTDVGLNSAAAPTNPIYYDTMEAANLFLAHITSSNTTEFADIYAKIPTGKYPAIKTINVGKTASLVFIGHEE